MISDTLEADKNANKIETFSIIDLSDNKSFLESFLRKSKTVFTSQINGYLGWGGLLLNIPDMIADTFGRLPTKIFPVGLWNADIADLCVPMDLYPNPFLNNSAKKFSMQFILDLVGDISHSEHQPLSFFYADS